MKIAYSSEVITKRFHMSYSERHIICINIMQNVNKYFKKTGKRINMASINFTYHSWFSLFIVVGRDIF